MKSSRFSDDKTRFTLWLSTATMQQVERAQQSMDKATAAEVIRDAIEVYLSLLTCVTAGSGCIFKTRNGGEWPDARCSPAHPPSELQAENPPRPSTARF